MKSLIYFLSISFLFSSIVFAEDSRTFLIQGTSFYEQWENDSPLYGGGVVGNGFISDHFSFQFVIQGDREKVELSPGFILAPIGAIILMAHSGKQADSTSAVHAIGSGFLFLISALENPNFHIPFNKHLDLSLSAHFLRLQITKDGRFEPKAGFGTALNITPNKVFTISPYAELNTRWEDPKPLGVQAGIRIGAIF